MKLKYTPEAIRDLQAIREYIGKILHNPKAARRIVGNIIEQCESLKEYPKMGISFRERLDEETDLRYLLCEKYLAFYRIAEDRILVVRILDGRTDYLSVLFQS